MFWKDGLSKKFAPEHDIFCNIWKHGIYFFQKIWYFFFRRKMKKDVLYQKSCGNMVFSVYMRRRYRRDIAVLAKKQRCSCPEKIHLRVASPASQKKMIFILENMVFQLKYHIHWHPIKGPRSSHRRCSTRKGALRNFAKFTGKDLCQSLFFNKATDLRPATLFKKKLWRRCFPMNFFEISINNFFCRTPLGDCFWSSNYSLFFYGDLYRRFYILLSSERKAGNLIYRIEIWLLLQFIWLEIFSQELYLEVCLSVN